MDPISQGALGALAATSIAKRDTARKAALVGWAAGMLADADIFIASESDPLLNIEYHRHFSHALLFIPIGALIGAAFFWLLTRRRWKLPFRDLFLFSLAGYATAGLLDACTSYGTRLYWPFSDERVAWNLISIVDPIFTMTMLVLLGVAVVRKRPLWTRAALGFVLAYLGFGLIQRERTFHLQEALAAERGHPSIERATVKPSIGNVLLWRSIYLHEDRWYVDAIRTGLFGASRIYEGESLPHLSLEEVQSQFPADSVIAGDLERFAHFSDHYLAWHPDQPDVLSDLRYAAVPNSILPLWGIHLDPEKTDQHVPFESFRVVDPDARHQLWQMLRGHERVTFSDSPPAD